MSREAMLIPHPEATVNAAEGWSNLPSLWPLICALSYHLTELYSYACSIPAIPHPEHGGNRKYWTDKDTTRKAAKEKSLCIQTTQHFPWQKIDIFTIHILIPIAPQRRIRIEPSGLPPQDGWLDGWINRHHAIADDPFMLQTQQPNRRRAPFPRTRASL
jgi:hypothetical protein